MIRSLAFTTQGRLHTENVETFLMPTLLSDTNLFLWIDLESPTAEEARFILEELFQFHPLSIEDCIRESPSPKVEEFQPKEDDRFAPYLFMVIHAVDYNRRDGVFGTSELNFFLGKNFLVTYHQGALRSVSLTEERAIKGTMHIARAPDRVAHNLLDSIVDNYKPALDELSLEIAELEEQSLRNPSATVLNKILQTKKEVHHLRKIIGPQREVLARFARGEFKLIRPHLVPYYRNVYDALFQISELAQGYTDSLTGILQVHLSMSSNRTGEVVKALTLITILSTPATIIASWYGMNFQKDMHEINWQHGYAYAFALTAVTTFLTYWYLKSGTGSEMASTKSSFLDKVLGRISRLDTQGLQTVVQRLARERSFLETLFNTIEDGVVVVDAAGRIIYFNSAVTLLIGLKPDDEGRHINEILPEVDWKNITKMDAVGGKRVARHEFEVEYPRPRFLRLYASPLDGEAVGSSGVALIIHDATEARQKTFEAIESERLQALTLLAASVAHEIGNPLNALHIHLQLMEREVRKLRAGAGSNGIKAGTRSKAVRAQMVDADASGVAEKLDSYLEVARGEIHRLDYIITQFLHAIRPAPLQLAEASLNDVVQKTLALLQPELDNRGITVKSKLARQIPLAQIDPTQVQQVLVNLVKNAMQAMTKGGTLTLQTGEGADGVRVSVSDTGGGIPQEQINRIFEPFYTTKKKGTGLGLMIVQRIVRAHGGRIELESHVGRGTTFRIWLPLQERKPRLLEAPPG